jgi:four helix bundle protein
MDHLRLETCVPTVVSMNTSTTKAVELQQRFIVFAADIIALSEKLPKSTPGRHICRQILRSGTATAANYAEARGAESRSDFVHKLGIVLKELNETAIWLELIERRALVRAEEVAPVIAENRELCRIITASIKTSRGSIDR